MAEAARIVKVEREEGIGRDWLIVTAHAAGGVTVTFRVPDYAARSYTIGRIVDVDWKLRKQR